MNLTGKYADIALSEMEAEQAAHVLERESKLNHWEPGEVRMIYEDPVIEEHPEGEAKLIEKISEDPPDVIPHLEYWQVLFDDGYMAARFIKSKEE